MNNKGIPTTYSGIQFRSRVEATWAKVMDLMDWQWDYEPQDFAGYIPDFHVRYDGVKNAPGSSKDPTGQRPLTFFMEVKGDCYTSTELSQHTDKIDASGIDRDVLLVGATPSTATLWRDAGVWQTAEIRYLRVWGVAYYRPFMDCGKCGACTALCLTPKTELFGFWCRKCPACLLKFQGCVNPQLDLYYHREGWQECGEGNEVITPRTAGLWAESLNTTQWHPPAKGLTRF